MNISLEFDNLNQRSNINQQKENKLTMKLFLRDFLKGFDLFSTPFVFFVGDKKSKSTLIGGILSLSIGIVSAIYFYYLINMYLSGKVEPKTSQSITIETESSQINVQENFLMFEMLINGVPLNLYEKKVGKKFLSYHAYYEQYDSTGACVYVEIPLVECTDSAFPGLLCLDENFIKGKNIYLDPKQSLSSDIAISVQPCDKIANDNCATDKEFYETIFKTTSYFQIYTKIKQYNISDREYRDSFKQDFFYFDPNLIVYSRMSLIKASTNVIQGMIIQFSEIMESIFDFQRVDTFFSQENVYDRIGIIGFAYIVFDLNQMHNIITIQHAMITEIFSQFMSIFNSLLTIGIIARMFAENHIVEDMNNILLKEYYKKTALTLLNQTNQKKSKEKQKDSQNMQQHKQINQNLRSKRQIFKKDSSLDIIKTQQKINQANFFDQKQNYFQISVFDHIKMFIRQILGKEEKKAQNSDQEPESVIYHKLLNQSMKRINIFQVYTDLIKLKMAIKLILTKEQYAAIQFCGSEIVDDDQTDQQKKEDKDQPSNNSCLSEKEIISSLPANNDLLKKNTNLISLENQQNKEKKNKKSQIENIFRTQQSPFKKRNVSSIYPEQVKFQDGNSDKIKNDNYQFEKCDQQFIEILQDSNISEIQFDENQQIEFDEQKQVEFNVENVGNKQVQNDQHQQVENAEHENDIKCQQQQTESKELDEIDSKNIKLQSHLAEMDKIEDNPDYQQRFLKLFLQNMNATLSNKNISQLSHIDKQIFQSLLFDQNKKQKNNYQPIIPNSLNNQENSRSSSISLDQKLKQDRDIYENRDENNRIQTV